MELNIVSDSGTKKYYESVSKRVEEQFNLALKAKAKQVDTSNIVECVPVTDLADRAEKLVGPKGIALRYREVLKENNGNRMQALFQIFREIIEQKWFAIPDDQKRVEQAIKTALVLVTEGVVVSPLDGLPEVRISKNFDNSKYIDVFFAGPIRAAGGSATVIPLILGDYARKLLALDRYKPTEEEVERYVEEIDLYQKEILSRQYKIPQEEIRTIIRNCPVCINGIPSEEREVSVNRDLPRMPSNRVRNGVALVVSEGIALKAMKILSWARELNLDWEWLESFKKVEKGEKITELKAIKSYLDGMAVGRPLLAYPSKFGGFRLRYGRGRNTAAMGKAINPALMILLDEFIAVGTHIRIERPGKAAQLFPCDSIDGPTVLLKNGTVMKVDSIEEAEKIKTQLEKILFLGDILITVGDFRKTAHPLAPSPYVEEWWQLELEKALKEKNKKIETGKEISFNEVVKLSKELGIPLHPKFIYYYTALKKEGLELLVKEFKEMQFSEEKYFLNKKDETKKLLEKIGVPHSIEENKIVFEKEIGEALRLTFGAEKDNALLLVSENILESLSNISGVKIKNKAGTFIGARMGRPEQAKPREMKGNPHVLFPIGLAGGATRSINKAIEKVDYKTLKHGVIEVEVNLDKKKFSGHVPMEHFKKKINLRELLEKASENLNERPPNLIKGVKGLFNDLKEPEALEKGILRAKHGVHVFRDGTSRFELLNAPLTHFTAKELNLSIKKVKELGYEKDVNGKEIESEEQIIELFPQDIVINETGGEWLVQVSKFIDDLLEKFYKTEPYYKAEKKEDLIGELVIGLAPHTSAGIVGRVLGYSKSRLGWGHPYFIMTKRRNVDGDQDSIMLLLDPLLNFSEKYLSGRMGGRMDTPLVFTTALNPTEIDDEVYEMETCKKYSLELYEKSQEFASPYLDSIPIVKNKLGRKEQYTEINFTHSTKTFDEGPKQSMYTKLKSMEEKIKRQANLQGKIKAVKAKDALERVLNSHFFPDIIGNARAFSRQKFRCTKCNAKYRRIPLRGYCIKCKNGDLILTIAQGSVRKYLGIAKQIINEHGLSNYLKQRIELSEKEIDSIFKDDKVKQQNLFEFV